jgi:heptosyltransferase-1
VEFEYPVDDLRILIVRTSALGDVVHALPVLTALRRHLPRARIGWVVEAPFASLLEERPDLDEVIVVRTKSWRRTPLAAATLGDLRRFWNELDGFSPDVVLDLMGNHKAGAISALTMADRRVGLAGRHRRERSSGIWMSEGVEPIGQHAVQRALSVLPALGLPVERPDFGAGKIFPQAEAPVDEGYMAILPGAGWENKRYPNRWWGKVAAGVAAAGGPDSRLLPGPGEEEAAEEAEEASGGYARLVPPSGLEGLTAALRGARLVLGGDTGPLHLAHALGRPVLCLMGPTDPERNGPYGRVDQALWKQLPCSFCHKRFDETKACLLEIPPSAVVDRAIRLLREAPS